MAPRRKASISARKQPQQARSTDLVAAILEAAVQVLTTEGAQRFTTARVAEKAAPVDPRKPAKPVSSSALAFPENYAAATADGVTTPALRKN